MDQSGYPLLWERDLRQQLPLAGPMIDTSCSGNENPNFAQPMFHPQELGATQVDPSHVFQHHAYPHYLVQTSRLNRHAGYSQPSLSQHYEQDDLVAKILRHPQVATYRDSLCHYLRLTPCLWNELYKPKLSTSDHRFLTECLMRKYGRLPNDLWLLINEIREQHDFPQLQHHLVTAILTTVLRQNPPQAPSTSFEEEMRSIESDGVESTPSGTGGYSPALLHTSSPVPRSISHTGASTPLSVSGPGSKSQSPYQRTKGRAPTGERYKCPYVNCKHEPFRNAGNFNNHLRSCHAESTQYRNRHPSDFLLPDISPQASNKGDRTPAAVTNPSNLPITPRRRSQGFGNGDSMGVSGQAHQSNITTELNLVQQPVLPLDFPPVGGTMGFAEFQMMEQQGWNMRRDAK